MQPPMNVSRRDRRIVNVSRQHGFECVYGGNAGRIQSHTKQARNPRDARASLDQSSPGSTSVENT